MCNRYQTSNDIERLRTIFGNAPSDWFEKTDTKYDSFCKNSSVPVVLKVNGEEMFSNFSWGIVPHRAKLKKDILVNSRSEKVLTSPAWKSSFRTRRCLMPATAFYESAIVDGKRHPVKFELRGGEPFSFAAIWGKNG